MWPSAISARMRWNSLNGVPRGSKNGSGAIIRMCIGGRSRTSIRAAFAPGQFDGGRRRFRELACRGTGPRTSRSLSHGPTHRRNGSAQVRLPHGSSRPCSRFDDMKTLHIVRCGGGPGPARRSPLSPPRNRPAGISRKARRARSSKKKSSPSTRPIRRRPASCASSATARAVDVPFAIPPRRRDDAAGQPRARARHRRDLGAGRHQRERRPDLRRADDVLDRPAAAATTPAASRRRSRRGTSPRARPATSSARSS